MAKVLIVDDDPDVVDAVQVLLKENGYDVASATSRAEGMVTVKEFTPELLILDCMMESADSGIVMAQELRRSGFTSPILMLTSIGRVMGLDFGVDKDIVPVDEFVEKPIQPDDLLEKVKNLLK